MIAISPSPTKLQKNQQVKDTNGLLDILKNNPSIEEINESLTKFKTEYSEIALERLLNYHLDNCIHSFLTNPTYKNACIVNDSKNIIETFTKTFLLFNTTKYKKRLADSIEWNTSLLNLSNVHLIDPLLLDNCKEVIKTLVESELEKYIESIGICSFDRLKLNESIQSIRNYFDFDFETLLLDKYIEFMYNTHNSCLISI